MAVCEGIKPWHRTKEKKGGWGQGTSCGSSKNHAFQSRGHGFNPGEGTKILLAKKGKSGGGGEGEMAYCRFHPS